MKKEMLVNVMQPEESRIAIIEDGTLEELYVERNSVESFAGNIYKGRVVNLEPSIQAAFVDFGVGRNGFLHVSDVEYQYYNTSSPNARKRAAVADRSTNGASATSRPSKTSSNAVAKCWCKSSRKGSGQKAPRFPPTSASPADTSC